MSEETTSFRVDLRASALCANLLVRATRGVWLGLVLGLCLSSPSAQAQPHKPTAEQIAAARTIGTEGLRLAEEGNCAAALEKLQRAEELYHAPTTLERLGECQIALGKLVQGTEILQRVLREQLPSDASPAFVAAQERARKALGPALARIASLKIEISAPAGIQASVAVDGEPLPAALLAAERPTDPGEHELSASAPGCSRVSSRVRLSDAQRLEVSLTLLCTLPSASAPPVVSSTPPTQSAYLVPQPTSTRPRVESSPGIVPWVLVAGGVALLGTGTLFGALAQGNKSDLEGVCTNKRCPSSAQGDIDSLDRNSLLSTVAFIAGAAVTSAGVVWLVWPRGESSLPPRNQASATQVLFSPRFVGLTGSF